MTEKVRGKRGFGCGLGAGVMSKGARRCVADGLAALFVAIDIGPTERFRRLTPSGYQSLQAIATTLDALQRKSGRRNQRLLRNPQRRSTPNLVVFLLQSSHAQWIKLRFDPLASSVDDSAL